ncbi:armadillo repeat-containing protein gudu isoform X2 [Ischnura elegans]|uniref:armadillo repeat-containing protein gudu isoform X2 n=1 Tax=Ischnura elegans TaxID=197161 RepID=UPI001ED885F7|nr:armadillo repeat-containing protein gudu isoform X2 [Ischnura elegans]
MNNQRKGRKRPSNTIPARMSLGGNRKISSDNEEIRKQSQDSSSESSSDSDDGEDSQGEEKEEGETEAPPSAKPAEVSSEYWNIQKLIKYAKAGNQTATIIALCCLKQHDLTQDINISAVIDIGGLEILINILETKDLKCKIAALKVLKDISGNVDVRKNLTDLGIVPLLVTTLAQPYKELQILAAETLANVGRVKKASRQVRRYYGIPRLVDLLDSASTAILAKDPKDLTPTELDSLAVSRAGARALWSLSRTSRNQEAMRQAGVVRLLARLLKAKLHPDVVVPIVAIVQQCASQKSYQLAIQTEGMIEGLVEYLADGTTELKRHCACAIFKCAEDEVTRDLVRQHGGLEPLIKIASDSSLRGLKSLLAAVTGAIWKCAISSENVHQFEELQVMDTMVDLLTSEENEDVLTNVVGAVAECARFPSNKAALRVAGGIPPIVSLLSGGTNAGLLENAARALGEAAKELESMEIIEELDGVRMVWSMLKRPYPAVQAAAAAALCPCIQNAKDSGEMVRSFVGGLELIVGLLRSTDNRVLASVCAALSIIALDRENLAVITDHGVVPLLSELVLSTDDLLRQHLAEAIANCCQWGNNCREFGRLGAITPLVGYMASSDPLVHRSTAHALNSLSEDAFNCVTMHQSGVVQYLLETIGSEDEKLQESSAGCLSNIRKLTLSAEKYKYSN